MKRKEKGDNDKMGATETHAGGVIRGTAWEKKGALSGHTESA